MPSALMDDLPGVLRYSYAYTVVKLQTECLGACWSFLSSDREASGWLLSTLVFT